MRMKHRNGLCWWSQNLLWTPRVDLFMRKAACLFILLWAFWMFSIAASCLIHMVYIKGCHLLHTNFYGGQCVVNLSVSNLKLHSNYIFFLGFLKICFHLFPSKYLIYESFLIFFSLRTKKRDSIWRKRKWCRLYCVGNRMALMPRIPHQIKHVVVAKRE